MKDNINGYPFSSPAFGDWEEMNKAAKALKDEGMIRYYRIVEVCKNTGCYELLTVDIDAIKKDDRGEDVNNG